MEGLLDEACREPVRRRARSTTLQVAVAVILPAAGLLIALQGHGVWHGFFDLRVYRGAVQWWLSGEPLYSFELGHSGYGFTYPPFAAVALGPLALLSAPVAAGLLAAVSLAVVVAVTWRMLAPVARRAGRSSGVALALVLPGVLMMDPVRETLSFGQVNLLLMGLVLADVLALRRGWRWAGAGTGLAAAIKLTPAIFVLYFVLTRRWRAAAVAAATSAAASLVAFLISPHTSIEFWTTTLWDTSRVGHVDKTTNQSLQGLLTRVFGPESSHLLWVPLAGAVLVFGMWRAARAYAAGDEMVGVVLTGLIANLISPISWTHHLVWLAPAAIVLIDVAGGRPVAGVWPPPRVHRWTPARAGAAAVGIAAVSWTSVFWFFQRDEGLIHIGGLLGFPFENAFVLIMLALVVLLPARAPVPAVADPASDDTAALAAD
jgi:alpha-1,2-mannosyltransferase